MSNRTAHYKTHIAPLGKIALGSRILVVDDDEAIRKLHFAIFTLEGYEVETAKDGADALEQMATVHFDLVVTDRQMPVLDGERMVLAMRSAGIQIPVVMVSGSLAQNPLCARVASEVFAALHKPIRFAEIRAAVFTALHPIQPRFCAAV